jgi:starch phosphorylase
MEFYDVSQGLKGAGGLGILAADVRRVSESMDLPLVVVTPFFRREVHQVVQEGQQAEEFRAVRPEDFGFQKQGILKIKKSRFSTEKLDIYVKHLGSTTILTMGGENFGELYAGDGSGGFRLYQQVALGVGGFRALLQAGSQPSVVQLNESATAFAGAAFLDYLVTSGASLTDALATVRQSSLYTNHTLVQAAESEFTMKQFQKVVFPNIKSAAVRQYLKSLFRDGIIKLSTLAIDLAAVRNGVSKLHARVADYHELDGTKVEFTAVTNGIDMNNWMLSETLQLYRKKGILDDINSVVDGFDKKLKDLEIADLRALKRLGRQKMNEILAQRQNQYGESVQIPEDAFVFDFKRRFTDYKRPWLPFENPQILREILLENDAYYIMAGKVHLGDEKMCQSLQKILDTVNSDPELKKRVHYIQDYDEEVARALSFGSNASINVPVVGMEACGTSWEKDMANLCVMISTNDGGVADVQDSSYLRVMGDNQDQELESLYRAMRRAVEINKNDDELAEILRLQLKYYLPIISGPRMMRDYLNLLKKI